MFTPRPGTKQDPVRRWNQADRAFFAHGACHILAGVYLAEPPLPGFSAERIIPNAPHPGNHIYVTNGTLTFDYRGYARRAAVLARHHNSMAARYPGWSCTLTRVDFDLLETAALNARKMRGPDQYHGDAFTRARTFVARVDHTQKAHQAEMR